MCADAHQADSGVVFVGEWVHCPRRQSWLSQYAACTSVLKSCFVSAESLTTAPHQVQAMRDFVNRHERVLWWIDGADVASTRAIVEIVQRRGGTIHVGQSTGATLAKRTLINEGWLGTTLAEISTHADLVITVGDCILSEAPLLPMRFLSRDADARPLEWWHLSASDSAESKISHTPSLLAQSLVWPRSQWLQRLTDLQLELQQPMHNAPANASHKPTASQPSNQTTSQESPLAAALRRSRYAVWIWDNSEFTSSIDELVINRLLGIARHRTLTARCSLLNLESQVGQLTAEETLLWLTGCAGTATWTGTEWTKPPRYAAYSADDWQAEFDAIALVRTVPSVAPLPQLRAGLIVATANELARKAAGDLSSETRSIVVLPIGHGAAGHLQRGDRGATLLVGGAASQADSEQPLNPGFAGCELFAEVAQSLATAESQRQGAR